MRVVVRIGEAVAHGHVVGSTHQQNVLDAPRSVVGAEEVANALRRVVAGLIGCFALLELTSVGDRLAFPPVLLPLGGFTMGFFGGLSGHQGALRSAFLMRCGLSKEAFIGSGVVCAVMVDVTRVSLYGVVFLGPLFASTERNGA